MSMKSLFTDGKWLKDREGRVVILRGINAGGDSKIPPFEPFPTERSAEQIRSWGMNIVRYVTVWEGVEPEKGVYSGEYIDRMEEIVHWFTSRGIYVFIDMHQDLFARKFCGDGAPEWATIGEPQKLLIPCGPEWFMNYLSEPVMQSFTRFWTDDELQSHFVEAFRRIAERFKDNQMVIGYEILNEPWHGSLDLGSGDFETNYLAPFYEKVIKGIREKDPGAIVFFEPAVLAGGLYTMQSQLRPLDAGNLVYAPHFYPIGALLGNEPDVDAAILTIDQDLRLVLEKADELGTPALLGEFGSHPAQDDGEKLIQGYYEMLDKYLMSGTIWTYAPRDMEWNQEGMSLVDSNLNERPFVNVVIRPYPRAIAGIPRMLSFDADTKKFRLEFEENGITAPTIIYIPNRVYTSTVNVQISDGNYEFDSNSEELLFYHESNIGNHWIEVGP